MRSMPLFLSEGKALTVTAWSKDDIKISLQLELYIAPLDSVTVIVDYVHDFAGEFER